MVGKAFLVLVLIALLFGCIYLYTNRVALKIVPENQPLTELYFTDYAKLPTATVAGQPISFSFTVDNLEGVTTTYPYTVYFEDRNGDQTEMVKSSVTVANNATTSVSVPYTFNTSNLNGSVVVDLTQLDQKIDFLLPNTNN